MGGPPNLFFCPPPEKIEYQPLAVVKVGCVHLCRVKIQEKSAERYGPLPRPQPHGVWTLAAHTWWLVATCPLLPTRAFCQSSCTLNESDSFLEIATNCNSSKTVAVFYWHTV